MVSMTFKFYSNPSEETFCFELPKYPPNPFCSRLAIPTPFPASASVSLTLTSSSTSNKPQTPPTTFPTPLTNPTNTYHGRRPCTHAPRNVANSTNSKTLRTRPIQPMRMNSKMAASDQQFSRYWSSPLSCWRNASRMQAVLRKRLATKPVGWSVGRAEGDDVCVRDILLVPLFYIYIRDCRYLHRADEWMDGCRIQYTTLTPNSLIKPPSWGIRYGTKHIVSISEDPAKNGGLSPAPPSPI